MTTYTIRATKLDGRTIEEKAPLSALQAYEKAAEMWRLGCHNIILTNGVTGDQINNVEKLLPYPEPR